ncbi:MAG: phosphomannomutase/phosphoglucomutase [Phycisphaerales bacterium JB037]
MLGRVFKAYDIRGKYGDLLTDQMGWQIGFGTSRYLLEDAAAAGETTPMMHNIVVGRDMRVSSPTLSERLISGIVAHGGHVIDVGMVDTPFIYFAVNYLDCAGGVMVTASHNPPEYNGFKISKRRAKPVGEATGLGEIRKYAAMSDRLGDLPAKGRIEQRDLWDAYIEHVREFLDLGGKSLKIVVDASNGMAGTAVPKVFGKKGAEVEGLEIIELNFDNTRGEFAHEPNPLVPANLEQLREAVVREGAHLGVCFDGDADRCAIVDEKGGIVGCDHLTALLARGFLADNPGAPVIYDLRSSKAVEEEIRGAGGVPIRSRVGHVFMKQLMADRGAVFGGELSGHFYFRDNFNADSGVIAMATVLGTVAREGKPVSELIAPIARYAQSGEINFEIEEKDEALAEVEAEFLDRGDIDELDGITIDCFESEGWWANIRKSNTEPLLRLNAEARDPRKLEEAIATLAPKLGTRVDH